jgi:hypothetical protein
MSVGKATMLMLDASHHKGCPFATKINTSSQILQQSLQSMVKYYEGLHQFRPLGVARHSQKARRFPHSFTPNATH